MNFPEVAPAFKLLRAGYDVWLGNQRGIKYSLGHKTLNWKTDEKYWEFSFTEMGQYDAPAQVDYVRNYTSSDKVTYIGHSQGTSQMFSAMSFNQTYWESRLNLFVALAPVTALWHTQSELFKYGSLLEPEIATLASDLKVWHILGDLAGDGTYILCGELPKLCRFAEGFLITQNPKLDNLERFQVYMGHFPAGASV
jgi:pimeloyl-ACP methyl ester carboxylesterase